MLNQWNNRFYNALQDRNWDTFVSELLFFCILAGAYILLAVYQLYLNQWLQIRWRQWMTKAYLGNWLDGANHYRMQLLGDAADNPDQRIAEDIQMFVERTLTIGIGLLSALVTLGSFVIILWTLSVAAPLHLFGSEWNIPGYLVWAALIYALIGTYFTHLIGWPLVSAQFQPAAVRSRLPLQSRSRARELRTDRAAQGRARRNRSSGATLQPRGGELAADHDAHQEAVVLHQRPIRRSRSCFPMSWSARPILPARCSSAG